jgi:hypothetical protein
MLSVSYIKIKNLKLFLKNRKTKKKDKRLRLLFFLEKEKKHL